MIRMALLDHALDPNSGLRHLTMTTNAMIKAAEFWAFLRLAGIPTASPDALDADAILAGQAALAGQPGDSVTIAMTNLAHLNRFPGEADDLVSPLFRPTPGNRVNDLDHANPSPVSPPGPGDRGWFATRAGREASQ